MEDSVTAVYWWAQKIKIHHSYFKYIFIIWLQTGNVESYEAQGNTMNIN